MTRQPRKIEPAFDSIIEAATKAAQNGVQGPNQALVAELAYQLWLKRGCPHGTPELDWLQAEEMLQAASEDVHHHSAGTHSSSQALTLTAGSKALV